MLLLALYPTDIGLVKCWFPAVSRRLMARERATWSLPESRRTEVIRIITERGSVSVPALVDLFQVSADTIRRDLDRLATPA